MLCANRQLHYCLFSGSKIENWHCIVRRGLVNASGTKLQRNGDLFGDGIYLSPVAATSGAFSGMSRFGDKVSIYLFGLQSISTTLR
jgi:hypothetical protein